MKTVTLAQLRTQVRQRADIEDSDFISDSELNSYINLGYAELYDLLVSRFEDYYTVTSTETVTSGNSSFSVPADFYKLRGIDRQIGTGEFYALRKFNFNERNRNTRDITRSIYGELDVTYRLVGNTVYLTPDEQAAGTYKLWYTPAYTTLSSDSDTLDGVNGWEEYVIIDAAIKCLAKEESSTTAMERQKAQLTKRIEEMASMRDFDQTDTITDVEDSLSDLRWRF